MKTDCVENVGKHAFEVAGLGLAPFRFVGASENRITYPDGTTQAGGSCDYCGTGIALECHILSADGQKHKVGCNCIAKVGDEGLLKAYKTSPQFRAIQRETRRVKAAADLAALKSLIQSQCEALKSAPHPGGFTDRKTGQPLTKLDWANWMLNHCGASGIGQVLRRLKSEFQ